MGRPKGYVCSGAVRAKMSAARKAACADPAVRAKMSGDNHWLRKLLRSLNADGEAR